MIPPRLSIFCTCKNSFFVNIIWSMEKDRPFFVALAACPGIGPIRFKLLLKHFKTARAVWEASDPILSKALTPSIYQQFSTFKKTFNPHKYIEKLSERKVKIITLEDKTYPKALKQLDDAPPVLYVRGELPEGNYLGVVGTRKITAYGKQVTEKLVSDLVASRFVVVSGLARGVDSFAHKVTIEQSGKTVAVLGGGVDMIYPPENISLAEKIIQTGGAVISEFPLGMAPVPGNFPARNRIISGLSLGVLVTEAGEDSGSLITADLAAEQGREVFAVPGPIYSKLSGGPAKLIKQGAKLVTSLEDILEELQLDTEKMADWVREVKVDSADEQKVVDLLKNGPLHVDEIARGTKINLAKLGGLLSMMELKGQIKSFSAGTYSLA